MNGERTIRGERLVFLAPAVLTWGYVVARAFVTPLLQDEAASFWFYAYPGEFLPFHAHPDAGNHFLNSLFGIIGYRLFGLSAMGLRWGSVLSFPVYAAGCWMLTRPLQRSFPRWCALLALVLCPFLLDYFAQFRGYGPAMAAWVWALQGITSFARSGRARALVMQAVAAFLGVFCDLSLLPVWALLVAFSVVLYIQRWHRGSPAPSRVQLLVIIGLQLVGIGYAAAIAMDLHDRGLLYLGSDNGFFKVTIRSLVAAMFRTSGAAGAWVTTVLVVMALAVAAIAYLRSRRWQDTLPLLALVLVAEVCAREAMFSLLGTNFPEDRAALHLVPLCILLYAYAADEAGRWNGAWSALPLLALPLSFLATLDTEAYRRAFQPSVPHRFSGQLQALQQQLGRPLLLSGFGQVNEPWIVQELIAGRVPIDMRPDPRPEDPDDARVMALWQLPQSGYHVVDSSLAAETALLVRDRPLDLVLCADTMLPFWESSNEFADVACPVVLTDSALAIGISGTIATSRIADVQFVFEVRDSTGQVVYYDAVRTKHWLPSSSGTDFAAMRALPAIPGGRLRVYAWDPRKVHYRVNDLRFRIHRIRPDRG